MSNLQMTLLAIVIDIPIAGALIIGYVRLMIWARARDDQKWRRDNRL